MKKNLHIFCFLLSMFLIVLLPYEVYSGDGVAGVEKPYEAFMKIYTAGWFYRFFGKGTKADFTRAHMSNPTLSPENVKQIYEEQKPVDMFDAIQGGIGMTHNILTIVKVFQDNKRADQAANEQYLLGRQEKALQGHVQLLQHGGLTSQERQSTNHEIQSIIADMYNPTAQIASLDNDINGSSNYLKNDKLKIISQSHNNLIRLINTKKIMFYDFQSRQDIEREVQESFDLYETMLDGVADVVLNMKHLQKLDRKECTYLINIVIKESFSKVADHTNFQKKLIEEKITKIDSEAQKRVKTDVSMIDERLKKYNNRSNVLKENLMYQIQRIDKTELFAQKNSVYRLSPEIFKSITYTFYTGPDAQKNMNLLAGTVAITATVVGIAKMFGLIGAKI